MGWVLTADDRLIEVSASGMIGSEVRQAGSVPGILVGRGAGANPTPAQDMAAFVPNTAELSELINNVRRVGSRLTRHPNFANHFTRHKRLLEQAMGTKYANDPGGQDKFLRDLGDLIATNKLSPVGIVTLGKNQPMAFAYRGRVGTADLTAVVFPSGQWNTLLTSGQGKASGFFYQMRFDGNFPFPFMAPNSGGGHARVFL